MREAGAGVMNFGVALEDVGGLSTKDVSVVLGVIMSAASIIARRSALHKGSLAIKITMVFLWVCRTNFPNRC
jgi:hypothetical protein